MADLLTRLTNGPLGRRAVSALGVPAPVELRRHAPGRPVAEGPVLLGAAHGGRLEAPLRAILRSAGAHAADALPDDDTSAAALVFDATGIDASARLRALHEFFHPVVRRLAPSGRLIVLGTPPSSCADPAEATAQQALEGFTRSMGKEVGRGATAQLVQVEPGAEDALESTLRFLLSGRSAYVSGQVVRVEPAATAAPADWDRPLDGAVVAVTGASRGIGEAIAATLARDGAHVVCVDVPAAGDALAAVANRIGGTTLQLDVTGAAAPATLVKAVTDRHGGLDAIVHNAGITRDRTLARMKPERWDAVLDVNLSSQERLDAALLESGALKPGGRIVGVSSVSGIAGNRGQSNYAASKAGVIGRVRALAPVLRERGSTINAVAPGFIETQMTAAMPFATREAGRRLNSLGQGGLPVDVAETVAWLAAPASRGVNGNVVRVCGQSLLGA